MGEAINHNRFRSDERREVALAASILLDAGDGAPVRMRPGAVGPDGRIDGTLMDISSGGAGMVLGEFVPRWARVTVLVHGPAGETDEIVRAQGVIRRVRMLDRRPSYLLGIGFNNLSDDELGQIAALIARIDGAGVG